LLNSPDALFDERLERVLLAATATLILLASTGRIGEVSQLFARRQVLPRHLVIVLRGSPHSSHRRGRRPRLIHLSRAVRVEVFFKVCKLGWQKCSPLDTALHQSESIFGE